MKFVISSDIAASYPNLRIGIVTARGIDNAGSSANLDDLKKNATEALRARAADHDLFTHANISAWRETYRSFGINPKRNPSTVEALLKRIIKGSPMPSISKVVDLYLIAELEFLIPVGGYDIDRIEGDTITLRNSSGGERFMPLGCADFTEHTEPNEKIYADSQKVLTRKWNYKDCESAKIVTGSRNIVLFTEAAHEGIPDVDLRGIISRIRDLILAHCGGHIETTFVDVTLSLEWDL